VCSSISVGKPRSSKAPDATSELVTDHRVRWDRSDQLSMSVLEIIVTLVVAAAF